MNYTPVYRKYIDERNETTANKMVRGKFYFIKEYDARLYLIANDIAAGKAPKFLTFSFDRMQKVTDTYDSFKEEFVDKVNYFKADVLVSPNGIRD